MPSYLIKTRAIIIPDTEESYAQIWKIAANNWSADFSLCQPTNERNHFVFIAQVTAESANSARYMLWNMQANVNLCMPDKMKVSFFWGYGTRIGGTMNKYLCIHVANNGSISIYPTYSPLDFGDYVAAYAESEQLGVICLAVSGRALLYNADESCVITAVKKTQQSSNNEPC